MNRKYYLSLIIVVITLCTAVIFNSAYVSARPIVSTVEAQTDKTKATLKGIIENGDKISQYGFRWGTSRDLGEKQTITGNVNNPTSFSTTINGLQAGKTYYYQAYAVNSKGSGYGDIKSFIIPTGINVSPSVSIGSPADKSVLTQGAIVKISAAALDDNKVESMELFINDKTMTKDYSDSITYDWDTSTSNPGEYNIKVTAWDGAKSGDKLITLLIKDKNQPIATIKNNPSSAQETNKPSVPVSRGTSSTDTSKYSKLSKINGSFGQFYYRDLSGARIEVDPQWIAENIITINLPGLNKKVQVNKAAADNFVQAFNYIKNGTATINGKVVPLLSLIKTMDGTFVTRHVNWDSSRGLSNHSWGTAIDINANNHFGYVDPSQEPNDPNVILWEKAFKPAGFSWGNSYGDSMHYEPLK